MARKVLSFANLALLCGGDDGSVDKSVKMYLSLTGLIFTYRYVNASI